MTHRQERARQAQPATRTATAAPTLPPAHVQVCRPEQLRIESVAGTGAFAVVYRGRLDVSDTLVAVKVMPMDPGMDEMMLVRNATELAALTRIRHHNVVQIVAHFPDCVRSPLAPWCGVDVCADHCVRMLAPGCAGS